MRALIFDGRLRFSPDHAIPVPAPGEALIRVNMAGICHTDIEIERGYMGFQGIPGHEFVGVVEAIAGDDHSLLGRRVVGDINCGCGVCPDCRRGLSTHCPQRTTLGIQGRDGCLADYCVLPLSNLKPVPDAVPDRHAVFVEPMAAAFEILEQAAIRPTDRVAVLGDGKLGLLIAFVLNLSLAEVTLVGKHSEKLNIVAGRNIHSVLLDQVGDDRRFDWVVEATGRIDGFELAQRLVRPRGTIVLKSTVAAGREFNLAPLVIDEITVLGSRCGPFAPALRALAGGCIDPEPLITRVYPFDQAMAAFAFSKTKNVLKVLVDMSS